MRRWSLVFAAAALAGCASRELRFNGKNLDGFYTFLKEHGLNEDPDGVFTVKDGVIRVSGQHYGYFSTIEEYENYHLTVEFKWGTETYPPRKENARDSGILFHMAGEDKVWPKSLEFQIIEGGTGDIILVGGASMDFDESLRPRLAGKNMHSPDGKRLIRGRVNWEHRAPDWKDVLGFRGPKDLERPVGEWNTLELICKDGTFTYLVNGQVVVRGRGAEPRRGRILLQSEGAELFFRKFELRPL